MSPAHHVRERRWRMIGLIAVVVVVVSVVAGSRGTPEAVGPTSLPSALVASPTAESSVWYCTGQSTSSGVAPGQLVVTNTTAAPVGATVSTVTDTGATEQTALDVPAHDAVVPSVNAPSSGTWVADTVTVAGGGVAVSQTAHGGTGWTVAPCQSTTSSAWYFAGGTTSGSDSLYVSLLNPTSTPVVVDVGFVTPSGIVHPINYQGIVLSPGQLQVEDVASEVQNQSAVTTEVTTRTGRVVAAEVQTITGSWSGLSIVPGATSPRGRWVIPQSQEVPGGASKLYVANPGDQTEDVTIRLRVGASVLTPLSQRVLPGTTWVVVTSAQTRIPENATYTATVEATGGPGVVVARAVAAAQSSQAPQVGLASAVDGRSAAAPTSEWVLPPPGTSSSPAVSGAAPTYVALVNDSSAPEAFSASGVSPSDSVLVGSGTLAPGATAVLGGSALSAAAADQIRVRSTGPMGVSEDVGPTGTLGVVTMPGIPLAASIPL